MRLKELRYLTTDLAQAIEGLINQYPAPGSPADPDTLLEQITRLLPIQKMDFDSLRRRIEGYHYAGEHLWSRILEGGNVERAEVIRRAQLKPLSHYHYLIGSREPASLLMTRDDLFNDPSTALVKLRDDILGLARVLPEFLQGTASAP